MKQPWIAIGMSRATWYRHGKPTEKPRKMTQRQVAASMQIGVRTLQRAARVEREAPEFRPAIAAGEMSIAEAERAIVRFAKRKARER
jgi:hypothetical protein